MYIISNPRRFQSQAFTEFRTMLHCRSQSLLVHKNGREAFSFQNALKCLNSFTIPSRKLANLLRQKQRMTSCRRSCANPGRQMAP